MPPAYVAVVNSLSHDIAKLHVLTDILSSFLVNTLNGIIIVD